MLSRAIKKFMTKGKKSVWNYILYGIGEIILVIIGILLAVQIDAKLTKNKEDKTRCQYLSELLFVLDQDISDVESNIKAFERWNPKMQNLVQALYDEKLQELENKNEAFGTVDEYINFGQGSVSIIEELKYSTINLITNRELKNEILTYQNMTISFLRDREKRYDLLGEDIRKYYTKNFISFNSQEAIPNDIEKLEKDKEFFSLVLQRHGWNNWFKNYYETILEEQQKLKKMISKEKKKICN